MIFLLGKDHLKNYKEKIFQFIYGITIVKTPHIHETNQTKI